MTFIGSICCCQKLWGVIMISIAVVVGLVFHVSQKPTGVHISLDYADKAEPSSSVSSRPMLGKDTFSYVLSQEQLDGYHRDGFVFVKRLLTQDEASQVKHAAEYAASRNFDIFGLFSSGTYQQVFFDLWRTSPEIASLSLQALPNVAAQLLCGRQKDGADKDDGSSSSSSPSSSLKPFRLLRDAYFSYAPPGKGCGWHVDDEGFFPADKSSNGPTFWIALDPLKTDEGGGIAVLNRTIFEQQLESKYLSEDDCRLAIKGATCDMEEKSPECQVKMDASKMEFDMEPGDALIWDRYTFHRGVPATGKYPKVGGDGDEDNNQVVSKKRYSVRYIPFGAVANGAVHATVEQGQTFDSPYYPQVWPTLLTHEMEALEHGLDQDVTLSSALQFKVKVTTKKYLSFLFRSE